MTDRSMPTKRAEPMAIPTRIDLTLGQPKGFMKSFEWEMDDDDHYAQRVTDLLAIGGIKANPVTVGTWHVVRDGIIDDIPAAEIAIKLAGLIYAERRPI